MPRRVTILDVATAAGVSRQTVTRAMNMAPDVSEETRARVLQVGQELGYRPNRFARNLVSRNKVRTIGHLVSTFRKPYYTDIAGDMLVSAAQRGWNVVLSSPEGMGEAEAIELLAQQVDVLVGHFFLPDEEIVAIGRGMPIISLERPSSHRSIHSVEVDMSEGVSMAIQALMERGSRRIGMIDSDYTIGERGAYEPSPRRLLFESLVPQEIRGLIVADRETIAGGAAGIGTLLDADPEVDGVFVFNDLMAMGVIHGAHVRGVAVPSELRVIGFDGLSLGEAVTPSLTTVSIDRHALVSAALDIANELLEPDRAVPAESRQTLPSMLWRDSA